MKQFPNIIAYITDFLFIYDFDDDNKKKYLDVAFEIIKNEQDEDTISILFGYISFSITTYLLLNIMLQYKTIFRYFENILENQLSSIE